MTRNWEIPHIKFSSNKTIVFVDFETTGFKPWAAGRIIEYSAIKVTPDSTEVFQELAKPLMFSNKSAMRIPQRIEELTKITNEMVENAAGTFEVFSRFHDFIDGHICIAHNARFELTYYQWYCDFMKLPNNCVFRDTQPMFKEKYKQASLSKITSSENAHMAFDDCVSMIRLMKECQEADPKLMTLCGIVDLPESAKRAILENITRK